MIWNKGENNVLCNPKCYCIPYISVPKIATVFLRPSGWKQNCGASRCRSLKYRGYSGIEFLALTLFLLFLQRERAEAAQAEAHLGFLLFFFQGGCFRWVFQEVVFHSPRLLQGKCHNSHNIALRRIEQPWSIRLFQPTSSARSKWEGTESESSQPAACCFCQGEGKAPPWVSDVDRVPASRVFLLPFLAELLPPER